MKFDLFNVLAETDNYIFLSTDIGNPKKLADSLFEYFFNERRIFSYFKCLEENLIFEPSATNYASLYQNLSLFFDSSPGISNDKAGKIGEYFLSILLLDFFEYECIIPKLVHITDQKMPIYGIDTLFYSVKLDLLMFGESKFSKTLSEGIKLIQNSLAVYKDQFEDEFRFIVLNNGFSKSKNPELVKMSKFSDCAINFKDFISRAKITRIGVPLFLCHGKDVDTASIMNQLKNIKKPVEIMTLKIKYIIISLPINSKDLFLSYFKEKLITKQNEYKELYEQLRIAKD